MDDTYDGESVLLVSSVDGFANLYALEVGSQTMRQLTHFEADLSSIDALESGVPDSGCGARRGPPDGLRPSTALFVLPVGSA